VAYISRAAKKNKKDRTILKVILPA